MKRKTYLATSGSCLTANRMPSVLTRIAQQGKHASNKIRIARWRMTPTLKRLLLPNVWKQRAFSYFVDTSYQMENKVWGSYLRHQSITCWSQTSSNRYTCDINNLRTHTHTQCSVALMACLSLWESYWDLLILPKKPLPALSSPDGHRK